MIGFYISLKVNNDSDTMKGVSLPIEMIVIVAIAVLVLVVIAAFFVGGAGRLNTVSDAAAFGDGCQRWKTNGCNGLAGNVFIPGYNPTGDVIYEVTGNTLATACTRMGYDADAAITVSSSCRARCGCPA